MIGLVLVCAAFVCILYLLNEFRAFYIIKPNCIYVKDARFQRSILEHCNRMRTAFVPTFWAFDRHLQTWLRSLLPQKQLQVCREFLEMADGGLVSLDWINREADTKTPRSIRRKSRNAKAKQRPILLIIPGIMNTDVKAYSQLCYESMKHGFKPVVYNRRGYAETPLLTPRVVTYCDVSDLDEVVSYINDQYPFSEIVAVAYSMEAGNLISYLAQEGYNSPVTAAVCVSCTFDCENLIDEHAMMMPYNSVIKEKLKSIFLAHPLLGTALNIKRVSDSKNIVELHSRMHAVVNQYKAFKDYVQHNNPIMHLNHIRVPLLFINSKDDPVVPSSCVPVSFFKMSEYCVLVQTQYGGHCGFYEGSNPTSWAESVALEFLQTLLNYRVLIRRQGNGFTRVRSMTT